MNQVVLTRHQTLVLAIVAGPAFWFLLSVFSADLAIKQQPLTLGFILQFCLLYPLLEELVFRGGIQGWCLKQGWGRQRWWRISSANLVTSILFSAIHLWSQPWGWALAIIVPSLLFGYLRERYRGVMAPILMHAYYNSGFMLFVMS